ncbi:hypothetical protein BCR34DRAFT_557338 [Clohesyomyces aquaticus]|uniref:Secreted protein n=1 Tax=Clohesyomyces aquaticus TaxID=1231657 RepID=A0A1Y2A2H3_9PLEO|nr:hypothetical protein BCR34DRAFT_557338 [Clohesyomyces aquaticus]
MRVVSGLLCVSYLLSACVSSRFGPVRSKYIEVGLKLIKLGRNVPYRTAQVEREGMSVPRPTLSLEDNSSRKLTPHLPI